MSAGSPVSRRPWNPLNWWRFNPVEQACPLYHFPTEIRLSIWSHLHSSDYKSVKQVCKRFQFDINQIFGVKAILCGPKDPVNDPILKFRKSEFSSSFPFIKKGDREIDRNVKWIQSVVPRTLTIRRFTNIPVEIDSMDLVNGLKLYGLSIELDQSNWMSSDERIRKVLGKYNEVKQLSVTCHPVDLGIRVERLSEAYAFSVANLVFNSLQFKTKLTQLSVSVMPSIRLNEFEDFYTSIRRTGAENAPAPVTDQWLQNPVKLTKLKIDLPALQLSGTPLKRWKKFLSAQNRLTHLTVNLGLVNWSFFSTVLQRSGATMEYLSLVLTNLQQGEIYDLEGELPAAQWFNWNSIALMTKLKSLRISTNAAHSSYLFKMIDECSNWPHDTHNLQMLNALTSLEKLVLAGIHLVENQLRIIFTELLSLRYVKLASWTRSSDVNLDQDEDDDNLFEFLRMPLTAHFEDLNRNFCELLNQVLELNRFTHIELADIRMVVCSEEVRQILLNQPADSDYKITWPSPAPGWHYQPGGYFQYPLMAQRK